MPPLHHSNTGTAAAGTLATRPRDTAASLGCPVARTSEVIGNRWTPLIVRDLAAGSRRFSELERSLIGVSTKTLSERLKRLEEAGVITRRCFAEVPPRVEYALTPKGYALLPVIESMREYGIRWLPAEECDDAADDSGVNDAPAYLVAVATGAQ